MFVNEIQIITTTSDHQWEVQQITVTPNPAGQAVGGTFRLTWNGLPPTQYMPFDEYDEFVEVSWHGGLCCCYVGNCVCWGDVALPIALRCWRPLM